MSWSFIKWWASKCSRAVRDPRLSSVQFLLIVLLDVLGSERCPISTHVTLPIHGPPRPTTLESPHVQPSSTPGCPGVIFSEFPFWYCTDDTNLILYPRGFREQGENLFLLPTHNFDVMPMIVELDRYDLSSPVVSKHFAGSSRHSLLVVQRC